MGSVLVAGMCAIWPHAKDSGSLGETLRLGTHRDVLLMWLTASVSFLSPVRLGSPARVQHGKPLWRRLPRGKCSYQVTVLSEARKIVSDCCSFIYSALPTHILENASVLKWGDTYSAL